LLGRKRTKARALAPQGGETWQGLLETVRLPEVKAGGMKLTGWRKNQLHCAGKWDQWISMGQR